MQSQIASVSYYVVGFIVKRIMHGSKKRIAATMTNFHGRKLVTVYVQWLTKAFRRPIKQNNFFNIGPNDWSFFKKLDRLVYWMMRWKSFVKIAIDRSHEICFFNFHYKLKWIYFLRDHVWSNVKEIILF